MAPIIGIDIGWMVDPGTNGRAIRPREVAGVAILAHAVSVAMRDPRDRSERLIGMTLRDGGAVPARSYERALAIGRPHPIEAAPGRDDAIATHARRRLIPNGY